MLHPDGVVRYAGPPSLVKGGTTVKRIPTIVWKEACEFSKTQNITPAQALLMIWEQKNKAQDSLEHLEKNSVNLSVIQFKKIEPPAEKSFSAFSAYETIQAAKVIEDTMDLCINPMIVLSLKNPDNGEGYKLIDGELQYLAYKKLGIKKVNVFILESEKELRNYQNQIQLFRNQRNGSKMKALEARINELEKLEKINGQVIEGNYVKIDKSVIDKYQEIAQKAKPASSRVEKLREFLQAVGFNWKKDEGRNWEYEG